LLSQIFRTVQYFLFGDVVRLDRNRLCQKKVFFACAILGRYFVFLLSCYLQNGSIGLLIKALVWFEKCEHVCVGVVWRQGENKFVSVFLFFLSLSFFSRSEQHRMDSCEITFDTKHK